MAVDSDGNWKPNGEGFDRRDQEELEKSDCSVTNRDHFVDICGGCGMKVILHCDKCKVQVTGCICLLVERHGHEIAATMAKDRGLILPDDFTFDISKLH